MPAASSQPSGLGLMSTNSLLRSLRPMRCSSVGAPGKPTSWRVMKGSTRVCQSDSECTQFLCGQHLGTLEACPSTTLHLGAGSDRSAGPLEWTFGESTLEQMTPKSKAQSVSQVLNPRAQSSLVDCKSVENGLPSHPLQKSRGKPNILKRRERRQEPKNLDTSSIPLYDFWTGASKCSSDYPQLGCKNSLEKPLRRMDSLNDDQLGLRAHLGNAEKLSIRGDCQELQPECHVCCPAAKEPVQAVPGCSQFGQRLLTVFPPHADGRLAYCRGANESPRLCLTCHLEKLNSVRRRVGEVTYHCEGKPSEKAGLDSELNLREEFRSIQLVIPKSSLPFSSCQGLIFLVDDQNILPSQKRSQTS